MLTNLLTTTRASLGLFGRVLLLMMLMGSITQAFALAPGVVTITNQASADYTTPLSPSPVTILSNTVTASVTAVESITLDPDRQVQSKPGDGVQFLHTLKNTGNITTSVVVNFNTLSGSDFTPIDIQFFPDYNGNGIQDSDEPTLNSGDALPRPLSPGEEVSLILIGTVPTSVDGGNLSNLQIVATASAGATARVVDKITILGQPATLILRKTVSQSSASIGEMVSYTIVLSNPSADAVEGAVISDVVPLGFSYVSHSARLDSAPIADPVSPSDRTLKFVVGHIDGKGKVTLTYRLRVGAGATGGNGVNTAVAEAEVLGDKVISNTDHAKVTIDNSVFDTSALIVGKIFVDCNRDDLQGAEELGIPGVRLYLNDGTYVISDEEGKYSIYGLKPRTYVLKIDRTTLPPGAEMATLSNRNAGDPQSLFVDLKNGEMHRADFAEASCVPEIIAAVKERRKAAGEVVNARIENAGTLDNDPLLQPARLTGDNIVDPRSRPAAGSIDGNGNIIAEKPAMALAPARDRDTAAALDNKPLARTPSVKLETLLPKLHDNKLAFIDLKDNDTLPSTDLAVRISGPMGSTFRLFVDSEEIASSRVGQRATMPTRQLEGWEYIGVKLKPGRNVLRAETHDSFGNKREELSIVLIAPGSPGKLRLALPVNGAVADGQTPANIVVRLVDANNVPVTARTMITLESDSGRWDVEDLDSTQPGVQTVIQGGEAVYDLIPPSNPGTVSLRVSSGVLHDEARLPLNPHLRPLIASGIIEGAVGLNKLSNKDVQPVTAADGFEQDIRTLNSEGTNAGVRGSMFLKGKVKGSYLLTLAYDSDKDSNERLFRDIDPENYYPVYGDSSAKGFDAQSTSKLYVRVDKGRSYFLYGDFNTQSEPAADRKITNYSRSLTGAQQHYENDHVAITLFASRDTSQLQTTEFRAQGISGPYQLPGKGFIPNSEKIEIVTRAVDAPAVILKTQSMNRYVDYTIDTLKGAIIFTSPVLGTSGPNNDLVFIRVTWEVDNGGDAFWVYGADGVYHLNKYVDIGASAVRDNSPGDAYTLLGANASVNLSQDTKVTAEFAHSEGDLNTAGNAWRTEVTRSGPGVQGRIYAEQSDSDFSNPSAGSTAGAREAGIDGTLKLSEKLTLGSKGLYSDSSKNGGGVRQGIFGSLEYAVQSNLKARVGVRYTEQDSAAVAATAAPGVPASQVSDKNVTSVNGKLSWAPERFSKLDLYTEYEQSVSAASERMLGVGASYQIADRSRLYARHEFISSTSGPFGLSELSENQNSTAIGLDYDYMKNGSAFSEYRVRDAVDGEQAQAALGLRNGWDLQPGLKLTTTFERQQPLSYSKTSEQATSVSLGVQYTADPLLKAGTRFEWRKSTSQTSILNTVALARKLSLDWSILGKNTLSWTSQGASTISSDEGDDGLKVGGPVVRDRFRVGAAWRQTDSNRWSWLGLYETRYDRDPDSESSRTAHILSSNVNYQPHRQWVFSGRSGIKLVNESVSGGRNTYNGYLLSGRAMFDITEKWDAGLNVSTIMDRGSLQYGVGAEVGYLLTSNLWISGGYNVFGYEDRDFDNSNSMRSGPYARLRFKFDEELFHWLE